MVCARSVESAAWPIAIATRCAARCESELVPRDPEQRSLARIRFGRRRLGPKQSLLAFRIEASKLPGCVGRLTVRPGRQHVPQVRSVRLKLNGGGQLEFRIDRLRFEQHDSVVIDQADTIGPLRAQRSPAKAQRVARELTAAWTVGLQFQRARPAHRRAALKYRALGADP